MRNFSAAAACILLCVTPLLTCAGPAVAGTKALGQAPKASPVTGIWLGTLNIPTGNLRLVLHLSQTPDGKYTATLDSPDQGSKGMPASEATFTSGALHVGMANVNASFDGKLSADGKEIAGIFKQGGGELPLTLKRVDKAPEVTPRAKRPQMPRPPFPYDQREVAYENKPGGVKLAGTLTYPRGKGPFPAVVLITGSGPQDRDESLLGHKPFLVLSDYLTRRGLAVLRVDDRGVGGSTGNISQSTTEQFAGDVLAGVEFLKQQPEVDPKQIGLIGHSEGGLIAPIVASRSSDVAFIVLMAGTGVTGAEIIQLQSELIARAQGAQESALRFQRKLMDKVFIISKMETDAAAADKQLREAIREAIAALPEAERTALAGQEAALLASYKSMLDPWFHAFLTLDPRPFLQKVRCPVLALNGEKDLQVPPKQNLPAIEAALKAGGNTDFTIKELPGLNHLFQVSATGSPSEYAKIEETISPAALDAIGEWIAKHTRSASQPGR